MKHTLKSVRALTATLITFGSLLGGANAAVIFTNGDPLAGGGAVVSDVHGPGFIASSFSVSQNETLRQIVWYGQYFPSNTPPANDVFTVQIYSNNVSSPAITPFYVQVVGGANRTDTGIDSFGSDVYRYNVDLSSEQSLVAGQTYWLSIFNDTSGDPDDNWAWQRETFSSGSYVSRNSSSGAWVSETSTVAFDLLNTASVPEPSSALLFGLGTLGLVARRRRIK